MRPDGLKSHGALHTGVLIYETPTECSEAALEPTETPHQAERRCQEPSLGVLASQLTPTPAGGSSLVCAWEVTDWQPGIGHLPGGQLAATGPHQGEVQLAPLGLRGQS